MADPFGHGHNWNHALHHRTSRKASRPSDMDDSSFSILDNSATGLVAAALTAATNETGHTSITLPSSRPNPEEIHLPAKALDSSLASGLTTIHSTEVKRNAELQATTHVKYGSGKTTINPIINSIKLLGPSTLNPSTEWVDLTFSPPKKGAEVLSSVEIKTDHIFESALAPGTGTLTSSKTLNSSLSPLSLTPHLSRDGGKGGYLKGQHLFLFCDTSTFTTSNATQNGNFTGFVSNSVAIDVGMNGLQGHPLTLQDGIGQWNDSVGRLRGFAPMTTGEEAFNEIMSSKRDLIAIWPESSLIPVDEDSAVVYANLVYEQHNMATQSSTFTYLGNTLLKITAGDAFGPTAARIAKHLFRKDEIPWGSLGGIRSWTSQGQQGSDGWLYLFGKADQGVLLARCNPSSLTDRSSYQYWAGKSWSSSMPPMTSTAYLINERIMDFDLFYSPRHLTFIMVYMTAYVDNVFYYRYLNSSTPILPPYAPGGNPSSDFVANIVASSWSPEQVLYQVPKPATSYAYSGSVHQGYFNEDDITNGGTKMLISWTAKTGLDAATPQSGYAIMAAAIEFN